MPTLPSAANIVCKSDASQTRLPRTIPAIVERAAREFASIEALVDERAPAHVRASSPTPPSPSAARADRLGHRARRPGRDLGAQHHRVGARRARRLRGAARVIVPLNTRFKGAEAAYILDRAAGASCCSPSPTSSTPTTSSSSAPAEPVAVARADRRAARLAAPPTRSTWADFLAARRRRRPRRRSRPAPRRSPATRSPTSSSRRARPAGRRARCSRTARACRRTTRGRRVVGLRAGDRYLIVNPFFHSFGLKAGILASAHQGRDDHPARGVRRRRRDAARRRGAHLDAARPAHRLPVDPRPPASRRVRPLVAAPRGHRRGAGSGRADPAHARGAEVRDAS